MLKKVLVNALLPLGLAAVFYGFFMFTKHDAALSALLPFANDPYDAIGSFGVESALILGLLALVRTVRIYVRKGEVSPAREVFLLRAEMAVVLAVVLTLVGDVVAMLRHLSQWTGQPATAELLLLTCGMLLCALLVGISILIRARQRAFPRVSGAWKKATLVSVVMLILLILYPENWRISTFGELGTVVFGALLLFVPMWALGEALLPYAPESAPRKDVSPLASYQWLLVVLLGALIGLMLVAAEGAEGGNGWQIWQLFRHLPIVLIYVGLEVAALLIGYGFLHKQLGLFQRE